MSNKGFAERHGDMTDAGDAATDRTLVLAVDTATDARSVCVARGAQILSLVTERQEAAGASVVLSVIDEALRRAGVELGELELFAVAAGPGSFTGLRAGLATIKAFAATGGRPVAPVPTLHAVALATGPSGRTVAAIPAGRGEVFAQLLTVAETGEVRELCEPMHVSPATLTEMAAGWGDNLTWAGGGAHAQSELISEAAARAGRKWGELTDGGQSAEKESRGVWTLVTRAESYAAQIARLGLISSEKGLAVSAEEIRAQYVRPSDAELK